MNGDVVGKLWKILDQQRNLGGARLSPATILDLARANGLELAAADLWYVATRLAPAIGDVLCPPTISSFIAALVADSKPEHVLDPWVGCGTLLAPVVASSKARRFIGICPSAEAIGAAELLLPPAGRGEYRVADPESALSEDLGSFDLVVSAPPFGIAAKTFSIDGVDLSDGRGNEILLRAALRLREDGRAMFVVTPRFLIDESPRSVPKSLERLGLHVDAFFSVPAGAYRPYAAIECLIAVIRRGPIPATVFVAEATDDPQRMEVLFANYRARRSGGAPELGALGTWPGASDRSAQADRVCENITLEPSATPVFRGFRRLALEHRIATAIKRSRLSQHRLTELCISITRCTDRTMSAESIDNSFYFPLIATSPVRLSRDELPKGVKEYALVVVDPSKADARVVVGFLNSELGREIRAAPAQGAALPRLRLADLSDVSISLPSLPVQRTIVETDQRLRAMASELGELSDQLWKRPEQVDRVGERLARVNHGDGTTAWLDTLPFPVASILWTAHTQRTDPRRHLGQLDYFFEGLTEFLAILLLSGAQQDPTFLESGWPEIQRELEKARLPLERASFGTWVTIYNIIAKQIRTASGKSEDGDEWRRRLACDDATLLESLVSKPMGSILQRANQLRNSWRGHGGIVSDDEARRRGTQLEELVLEVRALVGASWSRYPVVLPGRGIFTKGVYRNTAQLVSGVRHPFETAEFDLKAPMEDGVLHVVAPREGSVCPLLPFVRLAPSPADAKNACYFFNRLDGSELKYVSYHYDVQPELLEPRGGQLSVLDGLLKPL